MPYQIIGRKTADELQPGDWIISHQKFVQVLSVDKEKIITTGEPRPVYPEYGYPVYRVVDTESEH